MENTGFEKIDVSKVAPKDVKKESGEPHMKKKKISLFKSRKAKIIWGVVLVLVLLLYM